MLRTRAPVLRPSYNIFGIFRDEEVWAAVFMEGLGELGSWDRRLIELFCQNASVALENHRLHHRQVALSQAFARFVPQRLLELMGSADATMVELGDQIQREMTVVFVDLRSFTTRAEQQSPAATFEFLNQFFAAIVPAIHDAGGVVDKYLGDGLMALFPDAPANSGPASASVCTSAPSPSASSAPPVAWSPPSSPTPSTPPPASSASPGASAPTS